MSNDPEISITLKKTAWLDILEHLREGGAESQLKDAISSQLQAGVENGQLPGAVPEPEVKEHKT